MRKLIGIALLSLSVLIPAVAKADLTPEAKAYKIGLQKGIEAGLNFCRQYTKQELLSLSEVIDSVFNYKYLFLKGEVPPPVVIDRTEVESRDGVEYLIRKLEVLPPAYFPVDRIEALRQDLLGHVITIPRGYVAYVDVENVSLPQVAEWSYLAQTDGFSPVFVPSKNILILFMGKRKADALGAKDEAERIGIPNVKVAKIERDTQILVPQDSESLARMIKKLAQGILEKEKMVYGVSGETELKGINGVLYHLRKALALVDTINTNRYPDFNTGKLREDVNTIINQIDLYLAEKQPYRRLFIFNGNAKGEVSERPARQVKKETSKKGLTPIKKTKDLYKEVEEIKQILGGN